VFYDAATGQEATAQFPWTMTVVDVHDGHIMISGFPEQLVDFDLKVPYHPPVPKVIELVRTDDGVTIGTEKWFTFPLADGQRTCPDPEVMRYCWQVSADHERFDLVFVTNPDENSFEITPGVGITRYAYSHHGTTMQVTAKLVSHPDH
jgi:hypothetical protein